MVILANGDTSPEGGPSEVLETPRPALTTRLAV